jgi:nucleoside-diphosphate-sugar epimerase
VLASKKSFTKKSKVLLVGGSGYLGNHFFTYLKNQGFEQVYVGSRSAKGPNALYLDIMDPEFPKKVQQEQFDFLINFTGQITNPIQSCLLQNSIGIENLVKACDSNTCLVQLSSVGVYGSGIEADESVICRPETPYSTLKLVAEELLRAKMPIENLLVLRLSNIFGSTQPKGVFAYLKRSANSDQVLDFNNNGNLLRFFLHVEDVAKAIHLVLESNPWGRFPIMNIVGRNQFTVHQLIDLFEDTFGIKYQRNFETSAPYDNMLSISDGIFRELTGFQEEFSLQSYIQELG